ncbi:hypothetical protein SAM23877_4627 [Streptomyces ambofaciens ATCC 23877]|uniref:Uncharacterized protein n=1 Tax=Streptomyces ambofaciens (strain ATCC 23877 / 3486 / DSM 40053 / JCM 4204 / NBRC 12836 / NRRL B-2516) TaxID=278992 RepID=A0A0K2AXX5_STRA7|nr:hypothetical protein SAM23877_4627 [Streptomyces ambofaciens ATCC 23877]
MPFGFYEGKGADAGKAPYDLLSADPPAEPPRAL